MIFEGKIPKIVSYMPCPSGNLSGGAISEEYPEPGLNIDPITKDRLTAIAVVERYKAIVLSEIFPKLFMLVSEEIPETSEKNTSGIINIFRRLINIEPPRLKT
jgi:hypothetical protein